MKVLSVWIACTIALMLPSHAALGQNDADCQRVQFSEQILERFPNARDACLDVISRDGQEYAVFRANFERAVGNTLFVRFRNPDGSRGPMTRVPTDSDFRVLVDGEEKRVNQLARNQELTAYVQVSSPMIALAPPQAETRLRVVPLVVVPASEAAGGEPNEDRLARSDDGDPGMPNTAGAGPAFGVVGLVLVAVAVCSAAARRMRSAHHERLLRLP